MDDLPTVCDVCYCMYMPSIPGDHELHRKIHDIALNGTKIRLSNRDQIIFEENDYKLLLIDSNSTSFQFERIKTLSRVINASLFREDFNYHVRLLYPIPPEHKFFLLCAKSRVLTYLDIKFYPKNIDEPVWLIKMIWTAINYRNKGLARNAVKSALSFLEIDPTSVGWEYPFSKMGLSFVQALCPSGYRTFKSRS